LVILRILLSGASGLIGGALIDSFKPECERGEVEISRLVRRSPIGPAQGSTQGSTEGPAKDNSQISWDLQSQLTPESVTGFDAVIHLAGESVMGRWTEKKKKAILDSRVQSTRNLASALAQAGAKPRVFVCASAVGYYGNRGDEILREDSPPGAGFLSEVCREWESASRIAASAAIRTVNVRTGVVLSNKGGALAAMLKPFKFGVGGPLGSGQQWMSWIHIDDIVNGVRHALESDLSGPVNFVATNPVRNSEFTTQLGSALHRPAFFRVPEFALRAALGRQAAEEMLLSSQRVEPQQLQSSGYSFRYPDLMTALQSLV
jgi:uncharacterized protein (TIGR01777 family)